MKEPQSITTVAKSVVMLVACVGLIAGCGDRENSPDNGDGVEMGENPQSQPERAYNEDANMGQTEEQVFEASLEGSNEVPEVETEASGSATVTLRGDSIYVEGEFSDLGSEFTASHIHIGPEDQNGDPIQTLEPELGDDKTSGTWDASYQLEKNHITALHADSLYINVHTVDNKAGEIRGQLTSSGSGVDLEEEM